jgi:hypothetical protein
LATRKRKYSLQDIINAYETRQLGIVNSVIREIMKLMDDEVTGLAFLYAKRRLIGNRFLPKDIRQTIERISNTVNAKARNIIINGIKRSWSLSEKKNDEIEKKTMGSGRRPPPGKKLKVAPGSGGKPKGTITAVDEYIKRKTEGLGLSKRIWKLAPSFKKAVNDTMIEGLKKGTPSKKGFAVGDGITERGLGDLLRKNLRHNKFTENPGRGIYKDPQRNAERVARSEVNMAYANADFQRWQTQWFVIGIQVNLSNNHPKYDICDSMAGKYPKTFHFIKWHPNCLCVAIPVLADQKTRDEMMEYQLGLRDEPPKVAYITTMPPAAIVWMKKNATRVKGWSNQPYWLKANMKAVGKYFA